MNRSSTGRVLIVCTANAIRSPFVEHLLRARLAAEGYSGVRVESAGTAVRPGRPAEAQLVQLARGYGLDLESHRTRRLDESMLDPGMTVLCAANVHRRTVLDMRPELLDTTFTVREFARLLANGAETSGGWSELVGSASRRRTRGRRGPVEDDDLVDPIRQPSSVWSEFERDAVGAVEAVVSATQRIIRKDDAGRGPLIDAAPKTRREMRALRTGKTDDSRGDAMRAGPDRG
ncbi:hypothetical protein [Microbacterium enclense]|nr:hypothetical protein [Microbacterium enclense]